MFFFNKAKYFGRKAFFCVFLTLPASFTAAQDSTSIGQKDVELSDVVVEGGTVRKYQGTVNAEMISTTELFRAACCNLGESFSTNPSVDVSYSDAATGAQQIKLLGLSGTYVQMLTENIPNYRGAAMPYALSYVPGTWMQSIQVSKGASSVKNGYESITGQINVEFKKPQATQFLEANAFLNTMGKWEANFQGNLHLGKKWRTALLLHYEDMNSAHDSNKDGFVDMPKVRQYSAMSRWFYKSTHHMLQFSIKGMKEKRCGGQIGHDSHHACDPYLINIDNDRYEAFAKNALLFNDSHNTNIALILSGSLHLQDAAYGNRQYEVNEKNFYASLMYEAAYGEHHSLSAGISLNHDYFSEELRVKSEEGSSHFSLFTSHFSLLPKETVPGAYVQYTYKVGETLTAMCGLRIDHSNVYGTFWTPRAHVKWAPGSIVSLRASVGKGYRTPHVLAENNNLLASSRSLLVSERISQEEAWNYGISMQWNIPVAGKTLNLNAEYYYTNFLHQMVIDMDTDPHAVMFRNLDGDSYSHTWQVDATYPFFRGFTATAAYRRTNVKCTYGGLLMEKPLTNRYKGLLTMSYKPGLGKWQFDLTLQLNGGGRMPAAYQNADGTQSWGTEFKAYEQLNAQVTRYFRHFSIYAGGENITGFKQKNPVIGADNPWGDTFDSTVVWGPMRGAMYYIGIRFNWKKI
jgi:outer membrane receptor protein involved in Fe transport